MRVLFRRRPWASVFAIGRASSRLRRLGVPALAGLLLIVGCQAKQGELAQAIAATPADSPLHQGPSVAETIGTRPGDAIAASVPPGLNAELVEPLTGEALQRAQRLLADVRASLETPAFLAGRGRASNEPGDEPETAPDPPLATQRLYAAGRQQLLEGKTAEAVKLLEAALRVSPNEPALLKMLAGSWATLGNRVRAMQYLQQAVRADPSDVESMVVLGRFLVDVGDTEAGLFVLLAALDDVAGLADADPALPSLARLYLAEGLKRDGYLAAAIGQWGAFLSEEPAATRANRHGAELRFHRQRRPIHLANLGDMHSRLGDALAARRAYAQAELAGEGGVDLARRVVYTDLWLGRLAEAQERIVATVEKTEAAPAALSLIEYAVQQGLPAEPMVDALRSLRRQSAEPDAVTLALAAALPRAGAAALLAEHLDDAPADTRVLERFLALQLGEEAEVDDRSAALVRAADAIDADPRNAARRAGAVLAMSPNRGPLLDAFDSLPTQQRRRPSVRTLEAVVLAETDQPDVATELLDEVLSSDGAPPLARVEKARLLAVAGDYAGAEAVTAAIADKIDDPRLDRLRVGILLRLDRRPEALALLTELIERNPADLALVVEKARLLVRMDRVADAERTLLDALTREPKQELIYAELLNLYDNAGGKLEDYPQNYQRLVRRMLQQIPNSRTAQLTVAVTFEARRDYDRAEQILDALLQRDPDDRDAKLLLIDVYRATNRADKAAAIVETLLAEAPDDNEVVQAARDFYRRTGNQTKLDALEERWLRQQPESLLRNIGLARLLSRTGRSDEALALLDAAMAIAEPNQRNAVTAETIRTVADLPLPTAEPRLEAIMDEDAEPALYNAAGLALADLYYAADRTADFDRVMLDLLERQPNDPTLNNHLGYFWANAGRKLDEAERMIKIAHAADPQQSAYLDSLGWVYYKLGKFKEAEVWLRRAADRPDGDNPVILDHLADTLFRLGKTDEALELWQHAVEHAKDPRFQNDLDPEMSTVGPRAQAKLDAVEAEAAEIPVAPLGQGVPEPAPPAPDSSEADETLGDSLAPESSMDLSEEAAVEDEPRELEAVSDPPEPPSDPASTTPDPSPAESKETVLP